MKKGVNIGDFRNQNKTLRECFALAKKAGFDGVELCVDEEGELNIFSSEEEICKIGDDAKEIGVEIHSLMAGTFFKYSLSSENAENHEKAFVVIKKEIDAAKILGAKTVLIVPGMVDSSIAGRDEVIPYDVAYDNAMSGMRELVPYAESAGVTMAIENVWNKFLLSPLEMRGFIDELDSKYVGAYFDVANVIQTGFPEQWIRILGGRIKGVHFKDFKAPVGNIMGFTNLLAGSVNFPEVMAALSDIGYDGWVTSEISPMSAHRECGIYNTSRAMDYILGRE